MKSKSTFILFLLFACISTSSLCQKIKLFELTGPSLAVSNKVASTIKDKNLVVILNGDPIIDKYLKEAVQNIWHLTKNIDYIKEDNKKQFLQGKTNQYCSLSIEETTAICNETNRNKQFHSNRNTYYRVYFKVQNSKGSLKRKYHLDLLYNLDDDGKPTITYKDLLFAVGYIQNHLIDRAANKRRGSYFMEEFDFIGVLATKTLLIDKKDIDKKTTGDNIEETYTFPYKITNTEEIEKAILNHDKRYAYAQIGSCGECYETGISYAVNCEDGHVISTGELTSSSPFKNKRPFITKGDLKDFVKHSMKKTPIRH